MDNEQHKKQIETIYNIARDVIKEWWVVLFMAISISMLSYIASAIIYHPTYTSSTTFVVSARASSVGAYANQSHTEELTETFRSVMNSQILKKKVAEAIGAESFNGTVDIAVVPETNLLTVSVTSDSPEISFTLLNGLLEHYPTIGKNVLGDVVLEVFEEPNYPSVADQLFAGRTIMKRSFIIAMVAVIGILSMLSYLKDSVKTKEEIAEKLDTTIFGELEHEPAYRDWKARIRRNKKKLMITEPSVSFGFAESVKKMCTKLRYGSQKKDGKVLLVTSALRQEGKTTTAVNLALALSQRGSKVLLIEGNLRRSALAEYLGIEIPKGKGIGMYSNYVDLKDSVFTLENTNVQLLVNSVPQLRTTEYLGSKQFVDFMKEMREEMDFIIIDAPSAKGNADVEVLARMSDFSLLVVKQNATKVPYINDAIDMLNSYGSGLLGCVYNDVYSNSALINSGYGYGYGYKYGYGYRYGKYYRYGRNRGYGDYYRYGHYASQNVEEEEKEQ